MTSLFDLTSTGLPCRTTDPEIFFSKSSSDREVAQSLCHGCPTRTACLEYALDHPSFTGIWGGATHADRRSILRIVQAGEGWRLEESGRVRMACGTERAYRAHFGHREQPGPDCVDGDCAAAHEEHIAGERRERLDAEHEAGGSTVGFWLHRRLGEPPCEGCGEALRVQQELSRLARERRGRTGARRTSAASGSVEALPGPQAAVQRLALAG